jgi:hypothetical protein
MHDIHLPNGGRKQIRDAGYPARGRWFLWAFGKWGSCGKNGSENQAVKKPRFRGGSGAAEVLVSKGILDTHVSQPASAGVRFKAMNGSL